LTARSYFRQYSKRKRRKKEHKRIDKEGKEMKRIQKN
jgi:hypothetical protein